MRLRDVFKWVWLGIFAIGLQMCLFELGVNPWLVRGGTSLAIALVIWAPELRGLVDRDYRIIRQGEKLAKQRRRAEAKTDKGS